MLPLDLNMSRPTTAAAAMALQPDRQTTPRQQTPRRQGPGARSLQLDPLISISNEFDDGESTSPGASPEKDSNGAFTDYLDHAKLNKGRHNGTKNDTFSTPGRLHQQKIPGGGKSMGLGDANILIDLCEQGFSKSMRIIGKEILRETREQMERSMEQMRNETKSALEGREKDTSEKLMSIIDTVKFLHQEAMQPAKLDFSTADMEPLRSFLHNGEEDRWKAQRDKMQRLEERLEQNNTDVLLKVDDMKKKQEESKTTLFRDIRNEIVKAQQETDVVLKRSEVQLTRLLSAQEALVVKSEKTIDEVSSFKVSYEQKHAEFMPSLDARLAGHLRGAPLNVDLAPVVATITRVEETVTVEFEGMLHEVAKIQKALHLDFAAIKEEIEESREIQRQSVMVPFDQASAVRSALTPNVLSITDGTKVSKRSEGNGATKEKQASKKRCREYFTQTDMKEAADAACQTDPSLLKAKAKRRASVAKPKTLAAGGVEAKKAVFTDGEELKKKARAAAIKPQYNVFDYYYETGTVQKVAKSRTFEIATLVVIFANALWIAVDTDNNDASVLIDAHPVFQIVENCFCLYFTVELGVRFFAFKTKMRCLRDFWFVFDSILVGLMIMETWILTLIILTMGSGGGPALGNASIFRMIRMVKLFRVSRLARLLRAIPELVILMKGIGAASRSVSVFLVLWSIIIYVFAVVCRQLTDGSEVGAKYFASVPMAMNTLLLDGMLPDNAEIVHDVSNADWILWPIWIVFILLACITLMYMLIGVLVEIVQVIATTEKEIMTVSGVAQQLRHAVESEGMDSETATFGRKEFENMLVSPEVGRIFFDIGVDVITLVDSSDVIFEDLDKRTEHSIGLNPQAESKMTFAMFVDLVLNMRGSNQATVKDVKEQLRVLKAIIRESSWKVHEKLEREMKIVREGLQELREEKDLDGVSDFFDDDKDDGGDDDGGGDGEND